MDREQEIYMLLVGIDAKSIRALRENDATRLAELDAQAVALRNELKTIQGQQQ